MPQGIDDLLVAGRCISSEQPPYESHRATVPLMAVGQAAGVAAALCARLQVTPRRLAVSRLQAELLRQNAQMRR